jgi:dethiobiotin synthetase
VRGVFVTGTDTGVGKTVVAAALTAALARDRRVAAYKPVVTGLDDAPDPAWPPDHVLLAEAAGTTPEAVAPLRFGPPVSPHLAAEWAGVTASLADMVRAAHAAAASADAVVVEGVGGLLVPLTRDHSVRDLAVALGLPLVIAARPGLGTISHTLLTLEAARTAGLRVAAVVMTPWPDAPSRMEISNRATVERLGEVSVLTLGRIAAGRSELLAEAGASLPVESWLGHLRRDAVARDDAVVVQA